MTELKFGNAVFNNCWRLKTVVVDGSGYTYPTTKVADLPDVTSTFKELDGSAFTAAELWNYILINTPFNDKTEPVIVYDGTINFI